LNLEKKVPEPEVTEDLQRFAAILKVSSKVIAYLMRIT
jgi:hypothetical protein